MYAIFFSLLIIGTKYFAEKKEPVMELYNVVEENNIDIFVQFNSRSATLYTHYTVHGTHTHTHTHTGYLKKGWDRDETKGEKEVVGSEGSEGCDQVCVLVCVLRVM